MQLKVSWAQVVTVLGYVKKEIGSVLGAATGAAVMALLHAFGVNVDIEVATTIAGVCAMIGTLIAPPNKLTQKQAAKVGQ